MREKILNICKALAAGKLAVLVDDLGDRESGYLLQAAAMTQPEDISLIAREAGGIVLAPMPAELAKSLHLGPMTQFRHPDAPSMTTSIDAREGITTGISAHDRALSLRTLAITEDIQQDLVTPGHIFPVRARQGGVLVRAGFAEAAVDLLAIAKLRPVASVCHCLSKETGDYASREELEKLAKRLELPIVKLSEIIAYRMATESIIEEVARSSIPTASGGEFLAIVFRSKIDDVEHIALVKGEVEGSEAPVLTRVQAENHVGDLLGTPQALSRRNIAGALAAIDAHGSGAFVYVRHPWRRLLRKQVSQMKAGSAAKGGIRGATLRELGTGAQILSALGIKRIRLLTNSSRALPDLSAFNLRIEGRESFEPLERKPLAFNLTL